MLIPCIDLMGRKVVQLVQGQENSKVLELPDALAVLDRFAVYPQVQVIDLDAAMGREAQSDIIGRLAARKPCRVGGGVRSVERAQEVERQGAVKVIVGSSAFTATGINHEFLQALAAAIPWEKLMISVDCLNDHVAIHGWKTVLPMTSGEALPQLEGYCSEFLCTCIDVEGKHQGTRLDWFRKLRETTALPITAAGGITTDEEIRALEEMGMHAALGVAIYRRLFPELFPAEPAVIPASR
ncbi:MAG TPA: HisA/HisF-related TIM barrel protein [Terriglobia bacterium]|nr:HisA/HisF-related TIM barrel protein [Terriglobia bacterium]